MDLNGKKHFVVLKVASWLILAYTQTCVPAFSTSAFPALKPPSSCRISPGKYRDLDRNMIRDTELMND